VPTIASLQGVAQLLGVDVVDLLVDPKQSLRHRLIAKAIFGIGAQIDFIGHDGDPSG
jgi:fructose-1,6-bisphosphatase/sedoheptulose 1,7-bisphosphatase-like protein